jgi:H+/Cl- antiporter ClcA
MRWFIALFLLIPGTFLMWAMLKALRISGHQMNEDSKHLVSHRRKLYWAVVVCFLAITTVGAIVGSVLGDSGGSVTGTAAVRGSR